MAPKKFTYTPGTGGGKRTKAFAKKGAASKAASAKDKAALEEWAKSQQARGAFGPVTGTSTTGSKPAQFNLNAAGMGSRSPLNRQVKRTTNTINEITGVAPAQRIAQGKGSKADIAVVAMSALPVGKVAGLVGKGAKALANPAPAYAATKKTLPKAAKAAGQGLSVPRPSTRPGKSTEEALKYIAKKGGQGKGPRIPGDLVKRQRIRNLEKMLETGPAEQRAYTQGMLNALRPPSTAPKVIPPAKFPKGKQYKTEAPGRTKPLTDKEKNEIRDLMMPENIPGMSQNNARAITGRTKLSYAEAEEIAAKEKAAQEAIVASNKAAREAAKARGELPVGSKGILQEPQTLEDTMSKFPKPKPKPTKTKTDRAKALYQKRLDNWKAERDAWREKNTPERFRPKPKPESPLRKSEPAKAAEDAVPQRPADSKFKSRTAPAAVTKMKPEDWEIRAFTKSGKRMAADVPAQKALDKLTGKTPLDYGKKAAAPKPAKPAKPAAEKPAETPAASTPKKPSTKKKAPEAPKAAETKPVETPVETPAAPAAKKPSTKKKATAAPAAPEPKVETPTAPAPKKSTSKKPKVEKEEPLPERPADSKFKSRTTPASKRGVFTNKAGTRYVADVKAQKALDAALKSGDPVRIRSARAKWNALKQSKNFKRTAAGVAGASAALGVGGAIVGVAPGSKEALSKAGAKKGYQAGEGNGRLSGLYARQARAAKAETPEAPPKKKFGVAGESKFIKGRSAVRQSTIDQITKQGMAKSLAAVKSRKNDPEYIEAIRRFYGAKRLKEALKG